MKDGLWHGDGESYWSSNGQLLYSTSYVDGYREGNYIRYYQDGKFNDRGISIKGENISEKHDKNR